jgi:uncharacterized protein (DUF433 family)
MDDPGGSAPRDAALPETRDAYTQSDLSYPRDLYAFADKRLPLSASKSFIDGPAAASAGHRVHYDCGSTPKNPKAYLTELPNELLVRILKFAENVPYYENPMTSLSRTNKQLKVLADELLYKSVKIKNGSFFPTILDTLKKNAHLAIPVRSMTLEFAANATNGQIEVHRIPDVVPNIHDLKIKISGRYGQVLSGDSLRVMKSKLWDYPTLKNLDISVSINLTLFRHFLSLPFLETLKCDLPDSIQSAADWKPLVPKSNVRNLKIAQLNNFDTISQIVSSVQSLNHLGLHHSSDLSWGSSVSRYTIAQGLLTNKDSLESLEIGHYGSVNLKMWGKFRGFSKLRVLALSLTYIDYTPPKESSLVGMLPEGLCELSVFMYAFPHLVRLLDGYFGELLGLKEHSHLKSVKIRFSGDAIISLTGVRCSTIVETLQTSGIRVEVWRGDYRILDPVVSSLQDWEDRIEIEQKPDACVWDEDKEDKEDNKLL